MDMTLHSRYAVTVSAAIAMTVATKWRMDVREDGYWRPKQSLLDIIIDITSEEIRGHTSLSPSYFSMYTAMICYS